LLVGPNDGRAVPRAARSALVAVLSDWDEFRRAYELLPSRAGFDMAEADSTPGARRVAYIATPSSTHVDYVPALAAYDAMLVEEPLADRAAALAPLLPLLEGGVDIRPVDHKLWKASALETGDRFRADSALLGAVRHIEGRFFEPNGFSHGRGRKTVSSISSITW
jgi:hypothetical protein